MSNDIHNSCKAYILSFADDTTIYLSNPNIDQLYNEANSQINYLFEWFCSNKLSLNADKTRYIVIRPLHVRYDLIGHDIIIQNLKEYVITVLERPSNFLYHSTPLSPLTEIFSAHAPLDNQIIYMSLYSNRNLP